MRLSVVFRVEAQNELDEAYSHYEGRRSGLGEDLLAAVDEVIERIREQPHIYQEIHCGLRRGLTRRFPYAVIYRVGTDRIEVVAVYHSSRDPEVWRSRSAADK